MPALELPTHDHGVAAVGVAAAWFAELLAQADTAKPTSEIEPPLERSALGDVSARLGALLGDNNTDSADQQSRVRHYAVIETAVRDIFARLLATTSIESPEFVHVWNLLDILSILSDDERCDPALPFWIIEELLDSQTIAGCQQIFDFLESRRERITARHFKQKQLIILRSCNELLRRLSRAEDTGFCGRVFIFMFQSFPLGDKSSVNLRGEYHVENVTTYDQEPASAADDEMDTDDAAASKLSPPTTTAADASKKADAAAAAAALKPSELYPIFWSLQESFSQPKKLFDAAHFAQFRTGFEATMAAFRQVQSQQGTRQSRTSSDDARRGVKRKRDGDEGSGGNAFNPKYLTSRDLFELEISDLSFRRYVLVQGIIIMDFLLSLTSKAREKLSTLKLQNKSVTYMDQTLSEDDAAWAANTKKTLTSYLKEGAEGPYFCRMVETVLSRDKNWVRWKIENCPPIERPPLDPHVYADAKRAAQRSAVSKKPRPNALGGSLDLGFLSNTSSGPDDDAGMARLRVRAEGGLIPDLESFRGLISDADFDISMATDPAARAAAVERKASLTWRALRVAGRSGRLARFDKIESYENIDVVFGEEEGGDRDGDDEGEYEAEEEDGPARDGEQEAQADDERQAREASAEMDQGEEQEYEQEYEPQEDPEPEPTPDLRRRDDAESGGEEGEDDGEGGEEDMQQDTDEEEEEGEGADEIQNSNAHPRGGGGGGSGHLEVPELDDDDAGSEDRSVAMDQDDEDDEVIS